ncbi:hypothetical protein MCOR27_005122 [Pyricularia oryzae]|uniref:Uncharacterized protein n=1 Tax=Pyricularia grisea TaxID=148305 RepID=A0ABQ8NGM0_PYRGI|nr:hypothetical protein MCOR01_011594 [Pyricularia oryzae]KAI6296752.1 hypothetical protein MCOR33_006743 [Pyricularia grisea]TLD11466.1 hypothetical protein PspLS_11948 [Pyricularia sp. CBS 133598]KAI6254079.1 hypothetical protein MCOR19_009398 [Pyricularia oryzae]KAI6276396.1 hypothetical protein MCOR26_005610 [Pyricularia oryzae]
MASLSDPDSKHPALFISTTSSPPSQPSASTCRTFSPPVITPHSLAQWDMHPNPAATRLLADLPYITASPQARVAPDHAHIDHRHVGWPPAALAAAAVGGDA